jgi:hypothetical protein
MDCMDGMGDFASSPITQSDFGYTPIVVNDSVGLLNANRPQHIPKRNTPHRGVSL